MRISAQALPPERGPWRAPTPQAASRMAMAKTFTIYINQISYGLVRHCPPRTCPIVGTMACAASPSSVTRPLPHGAGCGFWHITLSTCMGYCGQGAVGATVRGNDLAGLDSTRSVQGHMVHAWVAGRQHTWRCQAKRLWRPKPPPAPAGARTGLLLPPCQVLPEFSCRENPGSSTCLLSSLCAG